jgi:hypothetical protein
MTTYEMTWEMYGSAEIDADSPEEAQRLLNYELTRWNGIGTGLIGCIDVDGSTVEVTK